MLQTATTYKIERQKINIGIGIKIGKKVILNLIVKVIMQVILRNETELHFQGSVLNYILTDIIILLQLHTEVDMQTL